MCHCRLYYTPLRDYEFGYGYSSFTVPCMLKNGSLKLLFTFEYNDFDSLMILATVKLTKNQRRVSKTRKFRLISKPLKTLYSSTEIGRKVKEIWSFSRFVSKCWSSIFLCFYFKKSILCLFLLPILWLLISKQFYHCKLHLKVSRNSFSGHVEVKKLGRGSKTKSIFTKIKASFSICALQYDFAPSSGSGDFILTKIKIFVP